MSKTDNHNQDLDDELYTPETYTVIDKLVIKFLKFSWKVLKSVWVVILVLVVAFMVWQYERNPRFIHELYEALGRLIASIFK